MAEIIRVKPAEGMLVRSETGLPIKKDGEDVVRTTYINRRINDGDLELIERYDDEPDEEEEVTIEDE